MSCATGDTYKRGELKRQLKLTAKSLSMTPSEARNNALSTLKWELKSFTSSWELSI